MLKLNNQEQDFKNITYNLQGKISVHYNNLYVIPTQQFKLIQNLYQKTKSKSKVEKGNFKIKHFRKDKSIDFFFFFLIECFLKNILSIPLYVFFKGIQLQNTHFIRFCKFKWFSQKHETDIKKPLSKVNEDEYHYKKKFSGPAL